MDRFTINKDIFKHSFITEGVLGKEKISASIICLFILVLGLCFVFRSISNSTSEDNLPSLLTKDYLERVGIIPSVLIREVTSDLTKYGQGESRHYRADLGDFTADFDSSSPSVSASSLLGGTIKFGLQNTSVSSVSTSSNSLIYSSSGSPVEVRYLTTPGRLKEDVVLKQKPPTNTLTFNFSTSGLDAVKLPDGYHFFNSKTGKESFWILNPTIVDKDGMSGKISMVIAGNTCTYAIDSSFLARAAYPVTIDPVMVSPSGSIQYSWRRQMVRTSEGRIVVFYYDHLTQPLTGPGIYYRTSDPPYDTWSSWIKVGGTFTEGCEALIDGSNNIYLTYDNPNPYLVKLIYSGTGGGSWSPIFQTLNMGSGYVSSLALEGGRIWSAGNAKVRYSDDDGATWNDSTIVPGFNVSLVSFGNKLAVFYMRSMGGNRWELLWRWRNNTDPVTSWSSESKITEIYIGSAEDGPYSVTSDDSGSIHLLYCSSYMFAPDDPSRDGLFYTKYDGSWSTPLRLDGGIPHPNPSWQALGYRVYPKWPSITGDGSNLWAYYSNPEPWPEYGTYRYHLAYRKWNGSSWEPKAYIFSLTPDDLGNTRATTMRKDPMVNAVAWMREFSSVGHQIWFNAEGVAPPNNPPVADANGPYYIYEGESLTLDGTASYDPDEPLDYIASYEWDLNADSFFDVFFDVPIGTVPWSVLESLGVGTPGTYLITLRVTDSFGETGEAQTTLTINPVGGPKEKIGPCYINSSPEYPHSDGVYNYYGPWYDKEGNPIPPDEQAAQKTLPLDVDIVHSLYLNTCEKWDFQRGPMPSDWCEAHQKDELYVGNVSPIEGYQDPSGKNGHDGMDICIKSNDEWMKSISWTGFSGVPGDDAEGYSLPDAGLHVYVGGAEIFMGPGGEPWTSGIYTVHEGVENLEIDVVFTPKWCNHAGKYQSIMTVSAAQL